MTIPLSEKIFNIFVSNFFDFWELANLSWFCKFKILSWKAENFYDVTVRSFATIVTLTFLWKFHPTKKKNSAHPVPIKLHNNDNEKISFSKTDKDYFYRIRKQGGILKFITTSSRLCNAFKWAISIYFKTKPNVQCWRCFHVV